MSSILTASHPGRTASLFLILLCALSFTACQATTLTKVTAGPHEKKIAKSETVRINRVDYPVPKPWQGHKLPASTITFEDLGKIPPELSHNGADVYILKEANTALIAMAERAREDNIALTVNSGYRSAGYQTQIFIRMMNKGRTFADIVRYVAPPGYSEHILGNSVDFYPSNWRFAELAAYDWLKNHAGEFGFTETYPENNSEAPWESWHWRFNPGTTTH